MRELHRLELDGFNITVPYKEAVLPYLDGIHPVARAIGAVNTVVRKGRRWVGFNTDQVGFITSLQKEGRFNPRGKKVLILGAGGSARAVAYGLAQRGPRAITIANRTVNRAQKMVSDYRRLFPRVEWKAIPSFQSSQDLSPGYSSVGEGGKKRTSSLSLSPFRGRGKGEGVQIDLVVNATSVGLRPTDQPLVRPQDFPRRTLFCDLIYNPAQTRLLRLAQRSGHRTLNGMGMLVYQGAEAFRLWTGRKAPIGVMRRVMAGKRTGRE